MDRLERIGAGVAGVVGMLIIAVWVAPKSDISPEQEAAKHLREAAGCFERNRHRILEVAGDVSRRAQIRGELIAEECLLMSRLSQPAGLLAADAVRRIDMAALARATNQIGMNRALDSVIAGFERQANRFKN